MTEAIRVPEGLSEKFIRASNLSDNVSNFFLPLAVLIQHCILLCCVYILLLLPWSGWKSSFSWGLQNQVLYTMVAQITIWQLASQAHGDKTDYQLLLLLHLLSSQVLSVAIYFILFTPCVELQEIWFKVSNRKLWPQSSFANSKIN